jgi:hypothetical protein
MLHSVAADVWQCNSILWRVSSAKVKNSWSLTPTHPHILLMWCLSTGIDVTFLPYWIILLNVSMLLKSYQNYYIRGWRSAPLFRFMLPGVLQLRKQQERSLTIWNLLEVERIAANWQTVPDNIVALSCLRWVYIQTVTVVIFCPVL